MSEPWEIAAREAGAVYEKVERQEDGTATQHYLLLEDLIVRLSNDAMRSIGAERLGATLDDDEFDSDALRLFSDIRHPMAQITQELAEHVYRATRAYLETTLIVPGRRARHALPDDTAGRRSRSSRT